MSRNSIGYSLCPPTDDNKWCPGGGIGNMSRGVVIKMPVPEG